MLVGRFGCREGLSYALLSSLLYGSSQLVILCFALLRSLAPQLTSLHVLTTATEADPTQGGAMFALAAMHTCIRPSDCGSVASTAGDDQVEAAAVGGSAAVIGADFISCCQALRAEFGEWAERMVQDPA